MYDLHAGLSDVFISLKLGWSLRKMSVTLRSMIICWLIYIVFSYAALMLTASSRALGFVNLFRYFELFPLFPSEFGGTWQYGIYGLGIVLSIFYIMETGTAVARSTFEDICGKKDVSIKELKRFARSSRWTIILSVVLLGLVFLVFPVSIMLWSLTARIPLFGFIIIAVTSIPMFVWGLSGVAVFFVFIFGFFMVPAILACTEYDSTSTVIEMFILVLLHPFRFFMFELASGIMTILSAMFLSVFACVSMIYLYIINMGLIGDSFYTLVCASIKHIPGVSSLFVFISAFWGKYNTMKDILFPVETLSLSAQYIAGWILGLSLIFIILWILSYSFATLCSSQVITYIALRKQNDGVDIRFNHTKQVLLKQ